MNHDDLTAGLVYSLITEETALLLDGTSSQSQEKRCGKNDGRGEKLHRSCISIRGSLALVLENNVIATYLKGKSLVKRSKQTDQSTRADAAIIVFSPLNCF